MLCESYYTYGRSELLDLVPANSHHILDCGCAGGFFGKLIKQYQKTTIVGIDSSRFACTLARKNLDYVIHDNLNSFDFSTLKTNFSLIIFSDVLEHLTCPTCTLQKAISRLDDNGFVLASIPNIAHSDIISQLTKGLFRYTSAGILDSTHLRFFTQTTIFQLFARCGLKIVNFRPFPNANNPTQYHILAKKIPNINKNIDITVIIPTYNCLEFTKLTVSSLLSSTSKKILLIIVDNNSSDGTQAWLRSQHNLLHIENTSNLGFATANNIGLELVNSPFFLLSNNDVIVPKNALDKLLFSITSDNSLSILGTVSNSISGPQNITGLNYSSIPNFFKIADSFLSDASKKIVPLNRIVFFFTLFKTNVLHDVGFLDENFGIGNYEDDDYCLRAYKKGLFSAYDESVLIHHFGSTTWKTNKIDYIKISEINKNYFIKKHNIKL